MAIPFNVDFDADHYALLGLPRRYALDRAALDTAWRELQAKVHPDRYATASEAERRVAMQWASRVNEAYRVLRSPLQRARYLCELAGVDVGAETNTAMSPGFLMQQMQWREALDEARETRSADALDALNDEIDDARTRIQREVTGMLDGSPPDAAAAAARVREWMFLERLAEQVEATHS
ncbi:Fe-S protein assembly co-chaperone HscB [Verticiella sediminum]|uniref:Co-chaperone protein HscB homolog n=1 Tax=Verticiella sediminum TaxID=1247510 RepID=A0A556AYX6_9BURK|nr:Fe-S protein assembly co-chaperone HscB [Verticiella sediminum]TSH98144.1 Fe-S protein assembly co-chaperone HscB [Verticiella sediminum]